MVNFRYMNSFLVLGIYYNYSCDWIFLRLKVFLLFPMYIKMKALYENPSDMFCMLKFDVGYLWSVNTR